MTVKTEKKPKWKGGTRIQLANPEAGTKLMDIRMDTRAIIAHADADVIRVLEIVTKHMVDTVEKVKTARGEVSE